MRSFLLVAFLPLLAACGDKIGSSALARINVEVDNQSVSNESTAYFGQALQQVVAKTVTLSNVGQKDLRIDGIDWATDEDGSRLKNSYVEIDWRGAVGAGSFPWTIDRNNTNALTFAVEYTPPLGKPLDDFSDSVLLIRTNAYNDTGTEKIKEFRIVFSMTQDNAIPRVTPISYNFQNATQARGETQEFRIYNDADLATAPFHITNVYLETASQEFTLSETPAAGTTVLEPGNPGYADVKFKVTYQPKDDVGPDTNAIIIQTDVGAGGTLRVPLSTGTTRGDFELSYSHVDGFDFTNVSTKTTRSVQITCVGPGPMTIKAPAIEPSEARRDYTYKAFVPATTADGTDTEVTSWPRGLNVGRSIRIDVEYTPRSDGSDSQNGEIQIPYENPTPGQINLAILSGDPKSKIGVAPKTQLVGVTGNVAGGDTGTRSVVVFNDGNGPLEVKTAVVHKDFDLPPTVWALGGFSPFTLEPGGVRVLELSYDLGAVTAQSGRETEYLTLGYHDDYAGIDTTINVSLVVEDAKGGTNPTVTLAGGSGATVDEVVTVTASGTAASGTIEANSYLYYFTAKPAGSFAKLNQQSGATASFTPDVAGDYTVEVIVYAKNGDSYLYSAPAHATVTVAP